MTASSIWNDLDSIDDYYHSDNDDANDNDDIQVKQDYDLDNLYSREQLQMNDDDDEDIDTVSEDNDDDNDNVVNNTDIHDHELIFEDIKQTSQTSNTTTQLQVMIRYIYHLSFSFCFLVYR